ncbi:hypothetical protein B0T10DRAFT_463624 [Thelonectria olida]|uniref:Uncharacterized protein n=1 Tax=Thelonectria olida TaxID=1576542 RepID=A0A9P8VXL7_9HYPO|nr:hypothetical protein B0T10DRAFT_463624 [Thelonectria olida]
MIQGRVCIAIHNGHHFRCNYHRESSVNNRFKFSRLFEGLCFSHRLIEDSGQVDDECKAIWGSKAQLRVQKDAETAKAAAGKLFASLFYLELCRFPDFRSVPVMCDVDVKCRLNPGQHLNAVVHEIQRQRLKIHYKGSGTWFRDDFCSTNWELIKSQSLDGFSRRLRIQVLSPQTILQVEIDSPVQKRYQERISMAPTLMELMDDLALRRYQVDQFKVQGERIETDLSCMKDSEVQSQRRSSFRNEIDQLECLLKEWK